MIVDFLTGDNENSSETGRLQEIQDVPASTMHGCEIAFLEPVEQKFTGVYPDGGRDDVIVRIASIQSFLVMKGLALHNRGGEDGRKDAYDIYYCIKHFPEGINGLVARFRPYLQNPIVHEGLSKIAGKFASIDHIGPKFVSERAVDEDERVILQRDSYEQIHALLEQLGIE